MSLSPEQLKEKLSKIANGDEIITRAIFTGAKTVQSEMSVRIFQEGKAVNGDITEYKNKEVWVSDIGLANNKGITHLGKPRKDKNGKEIQKEIKTTYFKNWGELKQQQIETSKPNMRLSNSLQNDFNNAPILQDEEITIKISQDSKNKIDGRVKRTGQEIFKLREEEIKKYVDTVLFELRKDLFNA
jgi:hypothetical protein